MTTASITRFTVEIVDRLGDTTLLKTAGIHYADAVRNATEELFDENYPDLAHFDHPEEDGFEVEKSMCIDDCQSIKVFEGHHTDVTSLRPIHEE